VDLEICKEGGKAYRVRAYHSRGQLVICLDGAMKTRGRKYTSYLVCKGIYLSPEWAVMEKIDEDKETPHYQTLEEDNATGKEIIEFVKNYEKGDEIC